MSYGHTISLRGDKPPELPRCEEFVVSEPISDELKSLEEWKRVTLAINDERGRDGVVEYVTVDFHDAFIAEMRARWERDITRLQSTVEIVQ